MDRLLFPKFPLKFYLMSQGDAVIASQRDFQLDLP